MIFQVLTHGTNFDTFFGDWRYISYEHIWKKASGAKKEGWDNR